jgi:hypothetical protein
MLLTFIPYRITVEHHGEKLLQLKAVAVGLLETVCFLSLSLRYVGAVIAS